MVQPAVSAGISGAPVVTEMQVIPVAGRDSMLLNLSGAHAPFFTRNIVILTDNSGHTGVGEVPGGEKIRRTLEDARPLVEQTFGKVAPQPAIPERRIRPQEPDQVAPRTVTLADPHVEQPVMKRYYLAPSATTAASGESTALDVLAQLMGGGSNSYLYRALVVDKPLAVAASAAYQGTALDPSQFSISAAPQPGVEFSQVEQAIDNVISDIDKNPIRAEDLERVKTQLIAEAIYAQDNQATMARWYGGALTTGLSIEDIRSWPDRIRAVTADQVRGAARKWLDKKRSVTGYLIKDTTPKREEKRS